MSDPQIEMTGVIGLQILQVWPEASKLLEPALINGDTLDKVLKRLILRQAQLWIAATEDELQAACVTEIYKRDNRAVCGIWLAGGKGVNNWLHFLPTIEEWAASQKCTAVVISETRPGWRRLLDGYRTERITLVKELGA